MAHIKATDPNVVEIPPVSQSIPPNPLLGYDGHNTAPPSTVTSTSSTTQSSLTHKVLLYDQRCFITGAVSSQLRACHLINAIRMDDSNQEEKLPLKKAVEHILTRQQFGIGEFFLDSLPNCIAMEAQWHGDLDEYGSFCLTIPLEQIAVIVTELCVINNRWDFQVESNPSALRDLDVTKDPFVFRKYDLLVLRPDLFLPENRPLPINMNRALRNPGEPFPTQLDGTSWDFFYSNSTAFLKDSSRKEFSDIAFKSLRRPEDSLSVFALLVNADSKLQSAMQKPHNGTIEFYAAATGAAVEAIFHVPVQLQDPAPSLDPPEPSPSSTRYLDTAAPGPFTEPREGGGDPQGERSLDSGPRDGGTVEEDHPNLGIDFDEPGYGSEEDDEPDTINGLTFPEMRTVLQRVSDGKISDRERAEAAMLMLGMAGGRARRPQALSPLIKDRV